MSDIALSDKARNMKLGIYEHYKKLKYQVLGVVLHSETTEEMVIYKQLYGKGLTWVRPFDMFFEEVNIDGVKQPRFKFIAEAK